MFNPRQDKTPSIRHGVATLITNPVAGTAKRIKSQDLFQHMNEVEIDHEGRIYRLRLTQLNKLILTA